jgi:DNA-binding CsgD family transcriptional regulator
MAGIDTSISFEGYLDKANAARSKEELFQVYSRTVAQHGLNRVLLCLATDHQDIGESAGMGFMHNYPGDWMKYYFEKGLEKIDPVMIYSLSQNGSYMWDEIPAKMKLTKRQQGCLDMGQEAGLHNGICTPLRGPNHAIAGLSLASSEKKDSFDGNTDMITAYSNHFYLAYRRLGEKEVAGAITEKVINYALTPKETDVLTWVARGKSYPDVATILTMSEHTVKFHMKNIFRKLGVGDQINAVVKALFYGLIHP